MATLSELQSKVTGTKIEVKPLSTASSSVGKSSLLQSGSQLAKAIPLPDVTPANTVAQETPKESGGILNRISSAFQKANQAAGYGNKEGQLFEGMTLLPTSKEDAARSFAYGSERAAAGLLGTAENITDLIGAGFYKGIEGITSLGGLAPNPVSEWAKSGAEAFLDNSVSRDWEQSIKERYNPSSGQENITAIGQTVVNMLPGIGASKVVSGTGQAINAANAVSKGENVGRLVFGLQAAGGGANEARQEGATVGQALAYGAASGLLETTIESVAGGIPGIGKGQAGEIVEKVIQNPAVRRAADIAGEGGEEALSTAISPYIKRAIYDADAETATPEEIAQSAVMGMVAAGVLQAGIELPGAVSGAVSAARAVRSATGTNADIMGRVNQRLSSPGTVEQDVMGLYSLPTQAETNAVNALENTVERNALYLPGSPLYSPIRPTAQSSALPTVQPVTAQTAQEVQTPTTTTEQAAQRRHGVQIPVTGLPMVNGPESSVGAARAGFDPYSSFLGTKSEFFPEGANAARPVDVPTTDAEGRNIRKTAATAMGAKAIPDDVVGDIQNMIMSGSLSYDRVTDKASIDRAVSKLSQDGGFQRGMQEFTSAVKKGVVSKDLATLGQQLLVNAANAGDENATAELLTLYAQMETTAGQAVQAASILRKLSPTAQLYAAQKVVDNLQETLSKKLKGAEIQIDTALIDEFNQQTTQEGRDAVMDKIYQNIADQVPSTWKDKWNAWRYLAMLGNPRTHIRNIVGNVGFQPVRIVKDRLAAAIESGVSAASGGKLNRTKSFAASPELYAAAWKDYENVADVLSGNKYDDIQSIINDKRTIFKTKPLEATRRINTNLLSAEDMVFKRVTYADALAGYLNANGVTAEQFKSGNVDPNLLSAARDYAGQEALKATYNDKNVVSDRVVQIARSLGTFGEAVLPFKRTPANILVRGFEYSPLGLTKGLTYDLYKVSRGEMTGAQAIDNIATGLTGTGLMALGAALAAAGVVTGGAGDDEKQAEWNELTGGQTYALNLPNGTSVTLDWLAPEALPFFMGVQAMQSFGEEGLTGDSITSAFASLSEPMLEMSMLQSLNDLIDNVSYAASNEKLQGLVGSALISYLTQAIPTIGGQIERTGETKRYSTYTDKDALLPTDVQYALGKAAAKIPGVDYQQVPYIDAWGREETTGTLPMRAFNNFLNPAYTSSLNVTPVDAEVQRLYNQTGIGSVIPSRADRSITVDGETVNLSGDQYVQYATAKGQTAFDLLSSIIESSAYKALTDAEKAEIVSDVYEYSNSVGKAAVSSYNPDGITRKIQDTGVDPADYILYLATADADGNSSITQGEAAVALLPMKNLTTEEKGKVWQSQNSSWSTEKNPFTGALANAGIQPDTAASILSTYSEISGTDDNARAKQTSLSKFLDGLNLTEDQRAVADDTFKFFTMIPATVNPYSIETMSDSAQKKWPKAEAWGMSEEDYLKFYPMVSSGKKADCLQALQNAGMTEAQANYFWGIVKKD